LKPWRQILKHTDAWEFLGGIPQVVVRISGVRRDWRAYAYGITQFSRARLAETNTENIPVAVDAHPGKRRTHTQKVMAGDHVAMQRGVL
jgi:hypothetical protein